MPEGKEFPWAWAGFPMAETLEAPEYGIFPAWNMDHVCDLWAMVEPWAMTHHAPLCPHWPHAQLKETPVVIWCSESLDSVYFPVQTEQRQQEEKEADSDCSESPNSSKASNMWVNLSPVCLWQSPALSGV